MFDTFEKAAQFIKQNQVQVVDMKFCDLWGRWHHLTVPATQFTPSLMEEGIGFDGSAVGLKSVKAGDMVLVPDLDTGTLDPFWNVPTLSFICTTLEADTHAIFANDPRNVAIRAEAYLKTTGIADSSRWGPEFEFYIFDSVAFDSGVNHAGYRLDSGEADWNSGTGGHGHYIPLHGGYHAIPPKDQLYNLRSEMTLHLQAMGVPVKYHHHEVGGPGQSEIETPMMGLVEAGDATMLVKYVTKMTAHQQGKTVTFMPKPLYGEAGSGMHFHQHLFRNGENVFYDPAGYGCMSQAALYYIGGLLKHGAALLAITNPSTNSYRRLVPGFEAPVNAFFSLGNRSAAVRIPKYANQPHSARMEFRPPDATCNVYLALAAQLLAGLDGIRREIDPTALGYGPIDANIFAWSEEQRAGIQKLPSSMREAMQALEDDHDFLQAGGVFSQDMIQQWINHKMEMEYYQVRNRPHPYEFGLYFDV
ncbi:MAG: type I glutamate--ammonia ligase [Anaerolineales bacterium]|jgi:glutamine synthetase|nr:type I glutamate--ammonia ligase [Anaerolineales bacterium]